MTEVKHTVLIVDVTSSDLDILLNLLQATGLNVLTAENGEEALKKLEQTKPDLILLDTTTPEIDGFGTYSRIQESHYNLEIPIIFLVSGSDSLNKIHKLNIGAVDYINKPFQEEELLARVNLHLNIQKLTKQLKEQNLLLQKEIQERQISEQKNREQAALLDISSDAILVQDLQGKILFWNNGATKLYGWQSEEALEKTIEQLFEKESNTDLDSIQKTVLEQGEWKGDLEQINKDRKVVIVASRWTLVRDKQDNPISILIVNTDITEKKQLETQFLRAQRMESLGILAGGIAHDLNNVLTPILMSVQLLELKLTDEQSRSWLEILEVNVKRAADLVKQVLSFARGVEGKRTEIQVKHLVSDLKQIVQKTFPKSIELSLDVPSDLDLVLGDATQLHQVFLNLCLNARDSMPDGGLINIHAENVYIDEYYTRMNIEAKVGSYISISVADQGIGIPKDVIGRIFEPFFTTKELGRGTGLGLSTVLGIVKSHGGFITVKSELERGTEFKVYLPSRISSQNTLASENSTALANNIPGGNGELILVVDDEDALREITTTILECNAYKVITAQDGVEAISLYAQHQSDIQVVLIDMMMPSMDGATTIRILEKINPSLKVVAVSGLVSSQQTLDVFGDCVKSFLPKPYTAEELLRQLHQVIIAC